MAASSRTRPSLEHRTKLDRAYWELQLFRDAAEAVGAFHSAVPLPPGCGRSDGPPDAAADAARRARGRVRRYCAANGLNRLGTLTYAGEGCREPLVLRKHVAAFFRRLRQRHEVPFPYLWTAEWHPGGHGLHVHFATGRFIHYTWIRGSWPHGLVHIKLLGDLPVGAGVQGQARLAARYLSKYVARTSPSRAGPGSTATTSQRASSRMPSR